MACKVEVELTDSQEMYLANLAASRGFSIETMIRVILANHQINMEKKTS